MFNVGDRVQHSQKPCLATVCGYNANGYVLLRFDDPLEDGYFPSGWLERRCTLVSEEPVIEEDWS